MSLKNNIAKTVVAIVGATNLANPSNIERKIDPQHQGEQITQQQTKTTSQRVSQRISTDTRVSNDAQKKGEQRSKK